MNLQVIRGGTKEELEAKRYSIGVGISLGNKWFTSENILGLVRWSLEYTRKDVVVYVADSIHAINLEVRKRISVEKSQKLADTLGTTILDKSREYLESHLSLEQLKLVKYAKWQALVDDGYRIKVAYLHKLYAANGPFTDVIHNIVKSFTAREVRRYTEADIHKLGVYLVEELPELLNRVKIAGHEYDAYAYPFDGPVTQLVEEIQTGRMFPDIRQHIMDAPPKVFLEVR